MSKECIYLIPIHFCSGGKLPIRYKVVTRKRDMRYTFCKKYVSKVIDDHVYLNILSDKDYGVKIKEVGGSIHLILPSGKAAYELSRYLQKFGYSYK